MVSGVGIRLNTLGLRTVARFCGLTRPQSPPELSGKGWIKKSLVQLG
jgi:hypothetical protein